MSGAVRFATPSSRVPSRVGSQTNFFLFSQLDGSASRRGKGPHRKVGERAREQPAAIMTMSNRVARAR